MSDNEIRVVITGVASDLRRALDGAKGDLSGLSAKIKEVPGQIKIDVRAETLAALGRLRELKDAAKDVPTDIRIKAEADTGLAQAKLRLLERQARETEESIARAQLGGLLSGGGGGGFGSTFAKSFSSGGLPGGGPLAIGAAGAPLAAGAVGSAIPLIGSAGAGVLGLGALATSVLGIGGVGLGSMLGVLVQAKTNISNVTTAMTALEKAQANYGASSKQAQQAQVKLNSAMAEAGPQASQIAKQLAALRDQWTQLSGPATQALDKIIIPALKMVGDLMPTVAGIAKQAFDAIGKALDPIFKGLSSPAFKKVLTDLGDAFARLAGPAIGAFSNLMRAFFSVAVAAAPYVIQIAQAFERWTRSFADSLSPGQRLNTLIGSLVSQAHSWWELTVALGRVLVTVFSGGAQQGQKLVDQLTALLGKWNAWLHTEAGQTAMHKFFAQSLDLLRSVAGVLGAIAPLLANLAVGLIPAMALLLKPLAELLSTISHWINDLSSHLPPVINALPGLAVAVGVLASWKALRAVVTATTDAMVGKLGLGGAAATAGGKGAGTAEAAGGGAALGAGLARLVTLAGIASAAYATVVAIQGASTGHPGGLGGLIPGVPKNKFIAPTQVGTFGGSIENALSSIPILGPLAFAGGESKTTVALQNLQKELKGIVSPAQLSEKQLSSLRGEIGRVAAMPDLTRTQRDGLAKLAHAVSPVNVAMLKAQALWQQGFNSIDATTGAVMPQIESVIATHMSAITANIQRGSTQWRVAIQANYGDAIATLERLNQQGLLSTSKMVADINKLLRGELKALGVTNVPAGLSNVQLQSVAAGVTVTGDPNATAGFTYGVGGSGGHAGGGYIGAPGQAGADSIPIVVGAGEAILNRHQQGPVEAALRHTYGMGLGDLFSQVTRPHYMARGGFAGGGTVSYSGLEGLWDRAGGNPSAAALMAAIAEAESGGNPNARNPSGASGLWQILGLPFPGNPFDPLTNARMAVAKYRAGGTSPWDASKAVWGKFLHGGVPPSGAGAGASIATPKWTGPGGAIGAVGKAAVAKAAAAANALLASLAPAGGGGGGGGTPGAQGPKGLGTFDGLQVADWIIPVLNWARSHGWGGHITSGFRPGFDPHAPSGSEHALTQWPGGAIDVGDPAARSQGQALWNVISRYTGHPNLIWGGPVIGDYGHFSGTGHARGGFAGGRLKGSSPAGMRNLSRIARHVSAQMLRATDLQNQYAGLSGSFGITEAAPQFLNPDGSLNAAGTAQHIADDNLLIGLDRKLLGIYEPLEGELEGELGHLLGSITGNQRNIGRDEKLIAANKQRIAALRTASLKLSAPMAPSKTLAGAQAQLRSLRAAFAKRIAAVPRGRQATAERAALHAQEAQQAGAVQSVIADERARIANRRFSVSSEKHRIALQIAALTGRDTKLAQDVTGMRSVLTGAGGGSSENQALSTIENAASSFGTVLWGSGGRFAGIDQKNQGVIFTTKLDLQALGQDIAKTTATAQSGPDLSALNALLTQQLQSSRTALAVSESQFGVLSGFAPLLGGRLVGSFQSGIDFVPRTGLALVHKGETITPDPYGPQGNRAAATVHTSQGETVIELHFDGDSGQLVKLVDARIGQKALRVVSDHAGQRARLLSGVRRP